MLEQQMLLSSTRLTQHQKKQSPWSKKILNSSILLRKLFSESQQSLLILRMKSKENAYLSLKTANVTHGGMAYGAGTVAAQNNKAHEIVDPRPTQWEQSKQLLRNITIWVGYYQLWDTVKTDKRTWNNHQQHTLWSCHQCTPIDLNRVLKVNKPLIHVRYGVGDETAQALERLSKNSLKTKNYFNFLPIKANWAEVLQAECVHCFLQQCETRFPRFFLWVVSCFHQGWWDQKSLYASV